MKHATDVALEAIGDLVELIRTVPGLVERKRGVFYRKGAAFLHFHEDPAGIFADLKVAGRWERFEVTAPDGRRTFVGRLGLPGPLVSQPPAGVAAYFTLTDAERIYPFNPVFRALLGERTVVLKRTRAPLERARAVQVWIAGLPDGCCVRPVPHGGANPAAFGDDCWVVYPFIAGKPYHGGIEQIAQAGSLLAALHRSRVPPAMPRYDWPRSDPGGLGEDLAGLQELARREGLRLDDRILDWLSAHAQLRAALQEAALPVSAGSWDYKANNLVFVAGGAILVDPDSAGCLPRVFDLALAALLFHNELATAPSRMWSHTEWRAFLAAYEAEIRLTDAERVRWPDALIWMYLEEAIWLLLGDESGWAAPHQRAFLEDLLRLPEKEWLFVLD